MFDEAAQSCSGCLACGEDLCASCVGTYCDPSIEDKSRGPVDVYLGEGHLDADGRSHCHPLHLLLFRLSSPSGLDPCRISSLSLVPQPGLAGPAEVG